MILENVFKPDANAGAKATSAIKQLSSRVIGMGDEEAEKAAEAGAKKSLLGGLDFKNLLAKKKDPRTAVPAE